MAEFILSLPKGHGLPPAGHPQSLPDGLVLTQAVCTGSGAASLTFTNYGTAAASGSVSFSYEVIK